MFLENLPGTFGLRWQGTPCEAFSFRQDGQEAQASVISVCAPARFCRDLLRLDLFLLWPQSAQRYLTATCLSVLCGADSMTPTPRSGALTDMEKWSRGLILDDYRSFGEYYSPSEWSSPTYWSLVEQINKLIKEKNLLLNECSDLRRDNQALRIDNEKLHEALLNCNACILIAAELRHDEKTKQRLSDASLTTACDSDGEQPPEEPAETSDKESGPGCPWRSITELSFEDRMTPPPSPSNRSKLPGNRGDALPAHQFPGEAETRCGTMPFEEEQGDQRRQEDSPAHWPCDSNGNDALKDASRVPHHEVGNVLAQTAPGGLCGLRNNSAEAVPGSWLLLDCGTTQASATCFAKDLHASWLVGLC
eukprot:s323_g32.t4